ncbi:GntR family transcriptional regulator [Pseudogracilibacillus sp. SE30717A]|uniref:GntR family transcriptional regulator n=1 Tax=Pseudogracilibacillus sp. SE30717A TaxID=3098293 RepID=UPI00300DC515
MSQIVKPESLHIQAYNILKQSILDGERQPSERIVEAKVAGILGISRGPVREAIRMLIQDGLLVYNDGFVKVYEPTIDDIREIFQCRESLESLAVKLAISNLSENVMIALEENLAKTKDVVDQGKALKQLDQQFHTIIIEASQNNHLIQMLNMIKTKIHYMRNSMIGATFYPTLLEEHERIYEAIVNRDVKAATNMMSEHIHRGLEGVLEQIK